MTISSQTRKAGPFIGNGSTTAFPFTFKVFAASDLVVTRANTVGTETVLAVGTDYTVALNSNQNSNPGGTVTLTSALALNFRLVITSAVPNLQPVDITNNGGFYPKVINDALDRLTILAQQNTLDNSRSVKVPVTSDVTGDQLTAQLFGARDQAAASASAAAGSAAAASSSASSASTSAANAAGSATSAGNSATNAAASATAAAGSATSAANSATTAGNNATTATTQATNAANSATAAATSATNAATSATTATTKAGEATTAAAAAAGSQTAAASSASAADTSATNAANSATSASNSAASATSSATAASTSASNAATSATNAANSATSAAGSATTATTQATNASNSASAAATSATNAATSATNAASSATSAASSLFSFRAVYLGSAAANPTVDGNGNALSTGDIYFNTVANEMRVWTGAAWQQVSAIPDTITERSFLATAGQTSYTFTGGYRVGATYVWVNGALLNAADIVATNGTTITFNSALALNDEVRILSFKAIGSVVIADISGLQTALDAKLGTGAGAVGTTNIADGAVTLAKMDANAQAAIANATPPGSVIHVAMNAAPTGWLKANGAAVSRSTYAALFSAIGTTFGAGNGSTTFNLPDLRGEFIRGWDDGRGVDSGRAFGSAQSDAFASHNHTQTHNGGSGGQINQMMGGAGSLGTTAATNSTLSTGDTETRPRNVALLACIKF